MKTFTKSFIVLLFAFGMRANAQITLQHNFLGISGEYTFQPIYLSHSGFKYYYLHADTITFYNLNYSFFRNAIFPAWIDSMQTYSIGFISEGLFDLDTTHIDYLIWYNNNNVPNSPNNCVIYRDNGSIVFSEDSADIIWTDVVPLSNPLWNPIIATDSGTFMIVYNETKNNSGTEIYKLPGTFPCIPGCPGNNLAAVSPINYSKGAAMKVFPNPAVSYTNIYYTLPPGTSEGEIILYDLAGRVLKKYTVTSEFDHLRLTTSDIAAGTYFYQLTVNGSGVAIKKIVVVK